MGRVVTLTGQDRLDFGFRKTCVSVPSPVQEKARVLQEKARVPRPRLRKIEAIPVAQKKLRVAAYCRVSTLMESQEGSVRSQRRHYEEYIRSNSEWEIAGIYMEAGVSGTKAESRPELQRMLNDCRAGKIDLILTKSISRFARNTADCLSMVRQLTDMGVDIHFEKENIHTGTIESEFMLSIMAGFAQDESKSISNNLKWGVHRRFEAGTYKTSEAPYGYRREGMNYVIVPEEAAVVKEIFSMLLSGKGMTDIAKTLNERGIPARNGGRWFNSTVRKIIHNREYTGDAIYQKSYMDDQYKQRKNRGEVDQYVNADHHEQIISREDFEKAAHVMERNRIESSGGRKSAFSGLLFCGKCGSPMHRKVKNGQVRYFCSGRRGGGIDCDNETEMEINIRNAFLTCLNKLAFSQRQREGRIIDTFILMIAEKKREKHAERITEIDSILAAHALEMNTMDALACIDVYREEQRKRKAVILREDRLLREEKEHLLSDPGTTEKAEQLKAFVSGWETADSTDAFSEDIFRQFVDRVEVVGGESVTFHFTCGLCLKEGLK